MTQKELTNFQKRLEKRGYRRYPSHHEGASYAYFKSFGRDENVHDEERSLYQIAFQVYDFSPFEDRNDWFKENPYSVYPEIMISRTIDERIDFNLHHTDLGLDIKRIEEFASEIMKFIAERINPPKDE